MVEDDAFLVQHSPSAEARLLYGIVGDENTVEELRELIAVPPKIERALQAFAKANPHEAHWIESRLMFRSAVLEEFSRLVREGIQGVDSPEMEESEPEPFAASWFPRQRSARHGFSVLAAEQPRGLFHLMEMVCV
jgi:hypothetical protein